MTPVSNATEQDLNLETKRITVSLDEVTEKIIENLIGVKGKSKSNVIYEIVKDWIDDNSEKILNNWGINFASIRRQVLSQYKEGTDKRQLSKEDLALISRLLEIFKTIKSIHADELAELLECEVKSLKSFIFSNRAGLEKEGLKLYYEDGRFFPA